jgi:hypothetical protein
MRTVTPLLTTGLAVALTLTIAGCFADTTTYTPVAEPTAAPLFASDEEALAAAEEAYRAYNAVVDDITQDGGNNPERLLDFASQELYESQVDGFTSLVNTQRRSVGEIQVDGFQLQSFDPSATKGEDVVFIYVCVDVSGVDLLDKHGVSVVSSDRQTRLPFEVAFRGNERSSTLIVTKEEFWTGNNFCV